MTDRNTSGSPTPKPDVTVTTSGGNRIAMVLVVVVLLILAALGFMLFGLGTEAADRSDPSTTTVQ